MTRVERIKIDIKLLEIDNNKYFNALQYLHCTAYLNEFNEVLVRKAEKCIADKEEVDKWIKETDTYNDQAWYWHVIKTQWLYDLYKSLRGKNYLLVNQFFDYHKKYWSDFKLMQDKLG